MIVIIANRTDFTNNVVQFIRQEYGVIDWSSCTRTASKGWKKFKKKLWLYDIREKNTCNYKGIQSIAVCFYDINPKHVEMTLYENIPG